MDPIVRDNLSLRSSCRRLTALVDLFELASSSDGRYFRKYFRRRWRKVSFGHSQLNPSNCSPLYAAPFTLLCRKILCQELAFSNPYSFAFIEFLPSMRLKNL